MSVSDLPRDVTTAQGRALVLRAARPTDQGYIAHTWVGSVLNGPRIYAHSDAVRAMNLMVDRLLDDKATRIIVASEPSDLDRVLGFIAFAVVPGARTLLYVVVRNQERRKGIGGALMKAAGLQRAETPISYLWDGPSSSWARHKRPDAVRIEPKDYLA